MGSVIHYQSSKGLTLISEMNHVHLRNSHAKLAEDLAKGYAPPERIDECAAMGARLDELDAAYKAEHPEGAANHNEPAVVDRVATIGDNNPPPSPEGFEAWKIHLNDLRLEAGHYLDGGGITTDDEARAVARLRSEFKKAWNGIEAARKDEKKPFDDAAKAVQEKYTPLLTLAKTPDDLFAKAETVWLNKKEAERAAEAAKARAEADAAAKAARDALEAANATANLEAREAAEVLVKEAAKVEKLVARIEKAPVQMTGGDRARSLRTYLTVSEVTSNKELLEYCMKVHTSELIAALRGMADADARAGIRTIPGCVVTEDRRVA
jgi:hypothetical protein